MNAAAQRKKFFNVEEANRHLPLVRAIVEDIVKLFRDVHERRERLNRVRQVHGKSARDETSLYGEELEQIERDLDMDIARLDGYVAELHELGALLKDPVAGLVDFPTFIDGREAYLCWKLGEEEIAYWHTLDGGFQGRQSLLERSVSSQGGRAEDES